MYNNNRSFVAEDNKGPIITIAIGIVLAIALLIMAFCPVKTQVMKVTAVSWERTIPVEYLQTFIEEDWSVPCGGRVVSSWLSLKSYTTSHTTAGPKGSSRTTYSTSYRLTTRYKYEIDRWQHVRTERAQGQDFNPRWPDVKLGDRERQNGSSQTYKVKFIGEDKLSYEQPFDEAFWKEHKIGYTYKAKQNVFGTILSLEDLK